MFDKSKKAVKSTTNFVSKHRVAIAVTITAAVAVKWQMNTQSYTREFLEAHNLYDEYLASFAE